MKEKKIKSEKKYECFFMSLYEDDVKLENGKETKRIYITHDGAAAVLPVTKDGHLILIKQFRYPLGKTIIEVPAGKKDDPNESGLTCAKRELEEETGYQSSTFNWVGVTHNCVGYSNEAIELFIATDCYSVEDPLKSDDDEQIELLIVSKQEAKSLLSTHQITDAKTWILLQHYLSVEKQL
ncbi:MAG: NUDIX hydrolase [Candidatus Izimaplasma sp.]|nr:NUDIX hydrolase [Candidatus Izimaplasma bacterium]